MCVGGVSRGCLGGVCVCGQMRVCTPPDPKAETLPRPKLRLRAVIMSLEVNRAPCAKHMDHKNSHDNNIRNLTLK